MLSIFSKNKKVLGLDITEEYIRYSLVLKGSKINTLLACGEEKIPRVEPRNALLSALRNVLRKTKCKNANISFPSDFVRPETVSIYSGEPKDVLHDIELRLKEKNIFSHGESVLYFEKFESINNKDFYNVFISSSDNVAFLKSVFSLSGLVAQKVVSRRDALLVSCVRGGEIVNTMALNIENRRIDIAIFSPFNRFRGISSFFEREEASDLIKETYEDFYKISDDKIGYFLVAGRLAGDADFINNLSRQTRLPVQEADVFVNFDWKPGQVPPVTREESFLYAVALGTAIS